jgi:cytochrome c553
MTFVDRSAGPALTGSTMLRRALLGLALLTAPCAFAPAALAQDIAEKAATCGACHGEDGKPISAEIPNIWGQSNGYMYLQMRDMKAGVRKNEQMEAILADISREDMRALAAYFSEKKWPGTKFDSTPEERKAATAVETAGLCQSCHLGSYKGDATVPRLANQNPTYLFKTMQDFRSKTRANNPFMTDLLNSYKEEDLKAMANYLAAVY